MIAAWAVYATLFALLLALAARAAEEALEARGLPTRWAWAAAAVGSVAVPAALRWDLAGRALHRAAELLAAGGAEAATGAVALEAAGLAGGRVSAGTAAWPELLHFPAADRAVLALWALGSTLILAGALRTWWRIRRGRRAWPPARVDGTEVRVSADTGPAVSGVLDPVIVVPRRILELPPSERRLVIRHEREHRDARDTVLLAAGLAALAACPWNPALWWSVRRLRLAVERDCDRRVIEAGADPGAYGSVLLAEAGGRFDPLPAAALGRGRSHLEARIRSLTAGTPRFRTLRSAAAAIAAGGLLLAACDAPTPAEPASAPDGPDATLRSTDAGTSGTSRAAGQASFPGSERIELRGDGTVTIGSGPEGASRVAAGETVLRTDTLRLEQVAGVEVDPERGTAEVAGRGGRTLEIRGNGSLDISRLPLIILDDERLEDGSALEDLDPARIESIEVFKGRDAESLYGPEAAEGVIRITTEGKS